MVNFLKKKPLVILKKENKVMAKKFKYTFYLNGNKTTTCVVNAAQKGAFERLMHSMAAFSRYHNYNVRYESIEITTD